MRLTWQRVSPAPALTGALAAAASVLTGTYCDLSPGSPLVWALGGACLATLLTPPALGLAVARPLAGWTIFVLVFSVQGSQLARSRLEVARQVRALPEDNLVEVEGTIVSIWSRSANSFRVKLSVDSAVSSATSLRLAEVTVRTGTATPAPSVANIGDRVRARGRLWLPEVEVPGPLTGLGPRPVPSLTIKSARQIDRLQGPSGLLSVAHRLHGAIYGALRSATAHSGESMPPAVAFFLALSIGEMSELPVETVVLFREGGVAHILAISGLQVGLVAGLLHGLLRWMGLGYRGRDASVLVFCIVYGAIAGGSAPVVRTVLTLGWYLLARLVGRPVSPWQAVGGAALVLILLDPASVFDVSFHLTFFAFAGLSGLYPPVQTTIGRLASWIPESIRSLLSATLAAELAVFPVQAAVFGMVPVLGLATNLIAVPLSSLFLVTGLCISPLLVAGGLGGAVSVEVLTIQFDLLERFLSLFEPLRPSRLIAAPALLEIAILAVLVLAGSITRERRAKAVLCAGAAGMALFLSVRDREPASAGVAEFWCLDVGQGDSWLLRGAGGTILVDGGGTVDPSPDRGRERILSLLRATGTTSIDSVVLTHGHPDHSRGVAAVLTFCRVGRLFLPAASPGSVFLDEVLDIASRNGVPVHRLSAGDRFTEGSWSVAVLHPAGQQPPRSRENNASLVLRATAEGTTVLLTGDIEALAERQILESARDLRADILKLAHHGSLTSTTREFLEAVSPRLCVAGVGKRNRFGHPAAVVIERLRERRIRLLRTDQQGTVKLEIRPGRLFPVFSPFSRR